MTKFSCLSLFSFDILFNDILKLIPVQKHRFFGIADDHVRKTRFIKPFFAELVLGDPVKSTFCAGIKISFLNLGVLRALVHTFANTVAYLTREALWSATIHCRFQSRELIPGEIKAAINRRTPNTSSNL